MVINATWGLGEAIVAGQVTPDTVIIAKSSHHIISRETTTKKIMTVQTDSGTTEQPVPLAQQTQPVLDDTTALELADYGNQIEAHYGSPMDIEWAIASNKIAILQARPITNLPPAPLTDVRWEPLRPGTLWMRRQVVEHMPEPLSPLFDELYLQEGLNQSLEEMATFMGTLSGVEIDMWDFIEPPFATTINGYAYSIASFDMNWQLIPLIMQMYIRILPKMIKEMLPQWRDKSLPAYQATVKRWQVINLSNTPDETLIQGIRELAIADATYWFAAAVPLGLARITDSALDYFLKFITTQNSPTMGLRLTSGSFLRGFPSKTAEAQAQLEAIARKVDGSDTLREQLLNTPASRLHQLLTTHPEAKGITADLQQYLDTYGHQIYNLDFAVPTLADDPFPVFVEFANGRCPSRTKRTRSPSKTSPRTRGTRQANRTSP